MVDAVTSATSANSLVNQVDTSSLSQRVVQAIKNAANQTGVDFSYLMQKASQESSFDPNAKSTASSAKGLFQFTNQTWLHMVKEHGDSYGLGNYADHITVDKNGVASVKDSNWRQAILNLRSDPQISANMAGELDKENLASLQNNVGGKIGSTDLYLAHFLGAGGASDFLNEMHDNPNASAASVLPDAAAANPKVFYTASGQPKTLAQIYDHFAQKFGTTTAVASASTQTARLAAKYQAAATPSSYTVASATLSADADTVSGNYTTPLTSSIKANTSSSLMATMILAQMNMDTPGMSSQALGGSPAIQDQRKQSVINILGTFS